MTQSGATIASVKSFACTYSSNTAGTPTCPVVGVNTTPNMQTVSAFPILKCVLNNPTVTTGCGVVGLNANVIQVTQTATIPTYFIQALAAFGVNSAKTLTINAMSSATLVGSTPPVNVAMVIDTTASMGGEDSDPNCNNTRIYCALSGVQTMLGELAPCATTDAQGNCIAHNQVSIFTFPHVEADTASDDTTCPSSNPTITPYSVPTAPTSSTTTWNAPTGSSSTYQIAGYLSNYSSNGQQGGSPNTSSGLTVATGASGVRGCNGMQTPRGDGTYYAGAINAAQTSLMAAQQANPGSQNVMIILSDGDANANSSKITGSNKLSGNVYGSANDQCNQAIAAAQNATNLNTTVYTIAYGSPSSGCSTDTGSLAISPCSTMKQMSSGYANGDTSHFYSDTDASGLCPTTGPVAPGDIFSAITVQFSKARLIPNS
jgi:hypothetical protein